MLAEPKKKPISFGIPKPPKTIQSENKAKEQPNLIDFVDDSIPKEIQPVKNPNNEAKTEEKKPDICI